MIGGEVLFGGTYALTKKNQRLSELIHSAGGLTPQAYPEGARLVRRMSDEELQRMDITIETALQSAKTKEDSIKVRNSLANQTTYPVGIELDKALSEPGSDADITLRDGDRIIIPQFSNTVKMSGEVMYTNTVAFKKGKGLGYYLDQAGGYSNEAKRSKAYIVYMNGTVARANKFNGRLIQPGCEIVVPKKDKERLKTTEILSLGSTSASLATVVIALTNILRN